MLIEFEKWNGCKNDFVLIWTSESQYKNIGASLSRVSPQICARHSGIGADGLIILVHAMNHHIPEKGIIINSDGSLAKTCGNGIRCAALSIYKQVSKKTGKELESVELQVEDRTYTCQFLPQKGTLPLVQVNMGVPQIDNQNTWHKDALLFVESVLKEKEYYPSFQQQHTFSLANQHLVFFSEDELSLSIMRELGRRFQDSPYWDGINVSFANPIENYEREVPKGLRHFETSDAHKVFIWERGVGETYACGSAACAVACSLLKSDLIPRTSWIPMLFPGGWLFAKQSSSDEDVLLCGEGSFTFSGSFDL
jgi:diaminopimelate epimerase